MARVMLRFRPIAPKPAVPGSGTVGGAVDLVAASRGGGSKRKSGGSSCGVRGRKKKVEPAKQVKSPLPSLLSTSCTAGLDSSSSTVKLSLMPETPDRKEDKLVAMLSPPAVLPFVTPLPWLQRRERGGGGTGAGVSNVSLTHMRPAVCSVTVEGITKTWRDWEVGSAEGYVWKALEADACPAFVTDDWDQVTCTNEACRKMVQGSSEECANEEDEDDGVRVGLVTRGMLPTAGTIRAFTCRVGVKYACRRRGEVLLAAHCDVCRLDIGGWAWRLDVKAALSLSL